MGDEMLDGDFEGHLGASFDFAINEDDLIPDDGLLLDDDFYLEDDDDMISDEEDEYWEPFDDSLPMHDEFETGGPDTEPSASIGPHVASEEHYSVDYGLVSPEQSDGDRLASTDVGSDEAPQYTAVVQEHYVPEQDLEGDAYPMAPQGGGEAFGQAVGDMGATSALTPDERHELQQLRLEQAEWERRELEYLRQERDSARERARQHLIMRAEQEAMRAETQVYESALYEGDRDEGVRSKASNETVVSQERINAEADALRVAHEHQPAEQESVGETNASPGEGVAQRSQDTKEVVPTPEAQRPPSPQDQDSSGELHRIAEMRERGRQLMVPDEDDLSMPLGQKIVLGVIVLLVLASLMIMLLPVRQG